MYVLELRRLKPDPLNLSVNTVVGKQIIYAFVFDQALADFGVSAFLLKSVRDTIKYDFDAGELAYWRTRA
jgi:hypothetical protein